jgi:pyrrolidone-carboxylate peptidase
MVTYFVVTGFGKFAGVDDNPSQALVQALQGYLKERGKGIAGAHALVPHARLPAHL